MSSLKACVFKPVSACVCELYHLIWVFGILVVMAEIVFLSFTVECVRCIPCLAWLLVLEKWHTTSLMLWMIFRSIPPSRPDKVGLKCPSIYPSFHKKFLHFNENWCVGRGWWLMHDGVQYDPIQGQGQGYEPLNVGNSAIFKGYLLPHLQWGLANDHAFLN